MAVHYKGGCWELMKESIDARAGWGQEAREPNKLACQTLDKMNAKKAISTKVIPRYQPSQRSAAHQTDLTSEWGRLGSGSPVRSGGEGGREVLLLGRDSDSSVRFSYDTTVQ